MKGGISVREKSVAAALVGTLTVTGVAAITVVAATGDATGAATDASIEPSCAAGEMLVYESLAYAGGAPGYATAEEAVSAYSVDSEVTFDPSAEVTFVAPDKAVAGTAGSEIILQVETTREGGFLIGNATYCSPVSDGTVTGGGV